MNRVKHKIQNMFQLVRKNNVVNPSPIYIEKITIEEAVKRYEEIIKCC